MINLSTRSYQPELLDRDDIPFADIAQNMKELNMINTFLGGHSISIKGLKQLLPKPFDTKPITICEIGCGGGDNMLAIDRYCKKNNIQVNWTGIDIKQTCIDYAKKKCAHLNPTWIVSDYAKVRWEGEKPAIIFSSLFCHHFTEIELVDMLQWMIQNAGKGFFINDLERHLLAYYGILAITSALSKSYLVKNDAPLSVARGFTKKEWIQLFKKAGISHYSIKWKWAFRHLIVYKHG
jgi:2-polyprenyl-3-methyl-5-hydroxy-6-metoxy-1,4-benzoquinol methylase